ncbi:MAG: 2-amino-4-hydroxy-6-hydroxymethyldihydropteridine diphosphokinase [Bacteroidetes bacterium]|nr:2-amino-4-hydroxy-6-hydroxymethyldihydropteridine diphosphokinase [Bacteroidota bacterium]
MNKAYLLIGGNEGNRTGFLEQACGYIGIFIGEILQQSSIFETAAWGNAAQPDFLNQALLVQTPLSAAQLMSNILCIEKKMGRTRIKKYGPRTIDIDILFYNKEIISLPDLKIPHPEMTNRKFVLAPMNEIAAHFVHPVLGKDIRALLSECKDELEVKKI